MLNFIAIAFYLLTRVSVSFGQKHARSRNVYVLILKRKNRWPHIPLNNKCCVELVPIVIKMVNLHETQRTPHHLQPLLQTFFVMNCSTVSWVFEMAEVETHWYRQTVMTFNVLFLCSNFKKNIQFTDILGEPTSILSYKRKQSLKMFNLFWRYIWRSRWMI